MQSARLRRRVESEAVESGSFPGRHGPQLRSMGDDALGFARGTALTTEAMKAYNEPVT